MNATLETAINNSGIAATLTQLQYALLKSALARTVGGASPPTPEEGRKYDDFILNAVGPAAAYQAVDYATTFCRNRGLLRNVALNGNASHNLQLIYNEADSVEFSNALRQYLMPRHGYFSFDQMVDPRHQIDSECGYPANLSLSMYRYMYERDDVARRVNDIYPDESWASDVCIYDDEDEKVTTDLEVGWEDLCRDCEVLQYLYRLDKMSGVGHYGLMLLGVSGNDDLEAPLDEPDLLAGKRRSVAKRKRELLYLRCFDEYLCTVKSLETDTSHPRYGLPNTYSVVFSDMVSEGGGGTYGNSVSRTVHWSRVIHAADNMYSSMWLGTPRMQPVFNRLLDLRKIKGASAEMFLKGGFPGIAFSVDPRVVADDPDFDKEEFREEIRKYAEGFQRYLRLVGIEAKTLAPAIADPDKHVMVQLQAIAAHFGVPVRIFLGSEEAKLASSEDKLTWNRRLGRRNRMHVDPHLLRATADRFIAVGVLPPPRKNKYYSDWSDLNTTTDEDKANLALKWTQALAQYVSGGIIHMIQPVDYMTLIMGLRPADARRLDGYIKENGGYEKLKKVDPSQSTGVNGKREDIASGAGNGPAKGRVKKRDTATKKTEGMKG